MSCFARWIVLLCLTVGLASAALAQERLPSWAAPGDSRPVEASSSSALDSGGIDPFPGGDDGPAQAPMQGLVLLAIAGAAYGARRLRAPRA